MVHDYLYKQVDTSFVLNHLERVKHVHLHDAKLNNDHLQLNLGEVNWKEKLKLVKANAPTVVIEVKTKEALIKSVTELKQM